MIWIAFALLTFATFTFLSRALSHNNTLKDDRANRTYATQLDEIERDLELNLLNEREAAGAKAGLERKLARSLALQSKTNELQSTHGTLQMVLAGLLLLGSLSVYLNVGTPNLAPSPIASASQPSLTAAESDMVDGMIKSLAQKLIANPDNLEGWKLLIRSLQVKQGQDAALQALSQAQTVFSNQPAKLSAINNYALELKLR